MTEISNLIKQLETLTSDSNISNEHKELVKEAIETINKLQSDNENLPVVQTPIKAPHRPALTNIEIHDAIKAYFANNRNLTKAGLNVGKGINRTGLRKRLERLGKDWKSIFDEDFEKMFKILAYASENLRENNFSEEYLLNLIQYFLNEELPEEIKSAKKLLLELKKVIGERAENIQNDESVIQLVIEMVFFVRKCAEIINNSELLLKYSEIFFGNNEIFQMMQRLLKPIPYIDGETEKLLP